MVRTAGGVGPLGFPLPAGADRRAHRGWRRPSLLGRAASGPLAGPYGWALRLLQRETRPAVLGRSLRELLVHHPPLAADLHQQARAGSGQSAQGSGDGSAVDHSEPLRLPRWGTAQEAFPQTV